MHDASCCPVRVKTRASARRKGPGSLASVAPQMANRVRGGENSHPECTLTYCVRRAIYLGDATQIVARACCAIRESVGGGEWKKDGARNGRARHIQLPKVSAVGGFVGLCQALSVSQHRTRPQQATTSEPSPGKKERNVFCHGACSNSREGTARPGARSGHSPFSAAAFWAFVSYQPVN
jgi:hypothetical protein